MTPTYSFGSTPVAPATAIASPNNAALGVPAGQTGGQGMGIPAGATATPPSFGDMALKGLAEGIQQAGAAYAKTGQGTTQVPGGAVMKPGQIYPVPQLSRVRMPVLTSG